MMDLSLAADSTASVVKSQAWMPRERETAEVWFAGFFEWMLNSDCGRQENNSKNNHGRHYDAQKVR